MSAGTFHRALVAAGHPDREVPPFDDLLGEFQSAAMDRFLRELKFFDPTRDLNYLTRVKLTNKGSKSAKSLVIDLDFDPVAYESSSAELVRDGRAFRMPELRPGQEVTINFWSGIRLRRNVRISHEDHVVRKTAQGVVTGWRFIVANYVLDLLPFALCGSMIFWWLRNYNV